MPQQAHAIIPWQETVILPDFYKLHRTEVKLDPEHAHWISGSMGHRQLMLSRPQLDSIADAAGITTVLSEPKHDFDGAIFMHHYIGDYEGAGGKTIRLDKHYSLDMRLKNVNGVDGGYILFARAQARSKAEKIRNYPKNHKKGMPSLDPYDTEGWEKWIEERAMADWTMTFRYVVAKAETGAYLRAIRQACNIRGTYDEEEFKIPWAVYRVEFDIQRALLAGGPIGEMAQLQIGAAMTKFLGLPPGMVDKMIDVASAERSVGELPEGSRDLLTASKEEIDELEAVMKDAGFKDRGQMDRRAMSIFQLPLSQLTVRQARIMKEASEIGKVAMENITDKDERAEFADHMNRIMQVCYATGSTIEREIEQKWWDAAHGIVEEGNGTVEIEPPSEEDVEFMDAVPVAEPPSEDDEEEPVAEPA